MKRYKYYMFDGIWDNRKEEYCSWYTIEDVMNKSDRNSKIWESKYDEIKVENQLLKQRINYLENLLRKYNIGGFK